MRSGRLGAKNVARFGVLAALMLALGLFERQFVIVPAVPGIRLGLSNVILLMALTMLGEARAWTLLCVKVLLGGALYAGAVGMLYSLAGGVLALFVMARLAGLKKLGFVGISVAGALSHVSGQVLISRLLVGSWAAAMQLPILLAAGAVTGALTGTACALCAVSACRADADMQMRLTRLGLYAGRDTGDNTSGRKR